MSWMGEVTDTFE